MGRCLSVRAWLAPVAATLLGCAPVTTLHGNDVATATAPSMRRVDDALTRHQIPAEGLAIHATLWDASLVAAAALEAEANGKRQLDTARWANTYLGKTSFTVVIEVEDRQPALDPKVITNAATWRFGLEQGDQARVSPSDVELLLVDRFPTRGGHYHHRLVLSVHFPGSLYELAAKADEPLNVRLWVASSSPGERRRPPFGTAMTRSGTSLRWRIRAG